MGYTDFGLMIRRILLERNMTMKQLASDCGISLSYLSDILRGSRSPQKQVDKIKEVLQL